MNNIYSTINPDGSLDNIRYFSEQIATGEKGVYLNKRAIDIAEAVANNKKIKIQYRFVIDKSYSDETPEVKFGEITLKEGIDLTDPEALLPDKISEYFTWQEQKFEETRVIDEFTNRGIQKTIS